MSTSSKLTKLCCEAEHIELDNSSKIVLMSDCHRGEGNHADNFISNQHLFFGALTYYYERDFTYIELGDGDELWENRKISNIIQVHSNNFWLLSQFYREGRFHMLYGNHDRKKQNKKYTLNQCHKYYCDSTDCQEELFPGLIVKEGIVLQDENGDRILLAHGHQGDLLNDIL